MVDSNQSLPTFGCTGSPGEPSHDIRDTLVTAVGKTRYKASANLFRAFDILVLRLIDTQCGSPKGHYVNRAEHQPQAEHVGHQDPLRRRLTLFTPHSTQIGVAGSAWSCC